MKEKISLESVLKDFEIDYAMCNEDEKNIINEYVEAVNSGAIAEEFALHSISSKQRILKTMKD